MRVHPLARVRVRVTLAATLAALIVAFLGSVLFVRSLTANLETSLESSACTEIGVVAAQLKAGTTPDRAVLSSRQDVIVQLVGADGIVIAVDHPRLQQALRTTTGISRGVRVGGMEDRYFVVAKRIKNGQLIVVGRSQQQVEDARATTVTLLLISVPSGLALLMVAVWLAVGRALRPVETMRRAADTITSAHLDRRLAVPHGGDEIPRLARTLNEMLDRIDASQTRQRQFVSDASHELRSPLAAIRQLAEVARDYPDHEEPGALARDVLAEEQRMEELVGALLVLARIDDGAGPADEPVDLDDVVLTEARRMGGNDGPALDVSGVSAGQVVGSPVLLGQVVRNLLGNALRHARTRVTVTLRETDGRVVLTVDDDGNGVPAAERERVFERFVRLDESRTRDAGGSGLGLAIVRTVTTSLHGTVVVEEAPGGGARFVVSLPRAGG
ncbi:MAG: ATP-binding region, ATPase domain protein [Nocardioidaceae bacterium]|nr:ATP-binding region, ATPase domain protein [Nocardioidaceae bacterium]